MSGPAPAGVPDDAPGTVDPVGSVDAPDAGDPVGDGTGEAWVGGDWGGFDWTAHQEEFAARRSEEGAGGGRGRLAAEFELGLAGGLNETRRSPGKDGTTAGVTVVTARLMDELGEAGQTCPDCHHTFRLGEEVLVERDAGTAYTLRHRGGLLGCQEGGTLDAHTMRLAADFHEGLDETNPPSTDMHPIRLAPGHRLLELYAGVGGRPPTRFTCWACEMTLRPGDLVIHCTCSPDRPGSCAGAIHRDPERGRLCYDDWRAHNDTNPCVGGGG